MKKIIIIFFNEIINCVSLGFILFYLKLLFLQKIKIYKKSLKNGVTCAMQPHFTWHPSLPALLSALSAIMKKLKTEKNNFFFNFPIFRFKCTFAVDFYEISCLYLLLVFFPTLSSRASQLFLHVPLWRRHVS